MKFQGQKDTPMTRAEFRKAKKEARQSGRAIKQKEKLASLSSGGKERDGSKIDRASALIGVGSGLVGLAGGVKRLFRKSSGGAGYYE